MSFYGPYTVALNDQKWSFNASDRYWRHLETPLFFAGGLESNQTYTISLINYDENFPTARSTAPCGVLPAAVVYLTLIVDGEDTRTAMFSTIDGSSPAHSGSGPNTAIIVVGAVLGAVLTLMMALIAYLLVALHRADQRLKTPRPSPLTKEDDIDGLHDTSIQTSPAPIRRKDSSGRRVARRQSPTPIRRKDSSGRRVARRQSQSDNRQTSAGGRVSATGLSDGSSHGRSSAQGLIVHSTKAVAPLSGSAPTVRSQQSGIRAARASSKAGITDSPHLSPTSRVLTQARIAEGSRPEAPQLGPLGSPVTRPALHEDLKTSLATCLRC